jgi:hypothetical protein
MRAEVIRLSSGATTAFVVPQPAEVFIASLRLHS